MLNNQQAQQLANFFKENILPTLMKHEKELDDMYLAAKEFNILFEKPIKMLDFNKEILKGTIMRRDRVVSIKPHEYVYPIVTNYLKDYELNFIGNKMKPSFQLEDNKTYTNITNKILDAAS